MSDFTKARLFSLFGIFPLGLWVIWHFWTQSYSQAGAQAYDRRMAEIYGSPLYWPVVLVGFYLPMAWHAVHGLSASLRARPNNHRWKTLPNLKFLLQRVSGLGLLLFLPAHLILARIQPALKAELAHEQHRFIHLGNGIQSPVTFAVYALGILGVAFHLANGIWGFSITWGLVRKEKAQRRMEWVTIGLFVLILAFGFYALLGFRSKG